MTWLKLGIKAAFVLPKYGIGISRDPEFLPEKARHQKNQFLDQARMTYERHVDQPKEMVVALNKKYEKPVLGRVRVWNLMERLAPCIDPSDSTLYCLS